MLDRRTWSEPTFGSSLTTCGWSTSVTAGTTIAWPIDRARGFRARRGFSTWARLLVASVQPPGRRRVYTSHTVSPGASDAVEVGSTALFASAASTRGMFDG